MRDLIRDQTKLLRDLAARPITVNIESSAAPWSHESQREPLGSSRETSVGTAESLVREISHSLNTPLSQVEIALSLLSESSEELRPDDQASLQRAVNSVAVCKAFIQAFRYVVLAERENLDGLHGGLLSDVLVSATLAQASQRGVEVVTNLSAEAAKCNDTFVLAVLIPLVENAIESSPRGERVHVSSDEQANRVVISVVNRLDFAPPESMYTPRFSTKSNHDGMGLVVVTRLLNSIPGAKLTHDWNGSTMTFQIDLPGRST